MTDHYTSASIGSIGAHQKFNIPGVKVLKAWNMSLHIFQDANQTTYTTVDGREERKRRRGGVREEGGRGVKGRGREMRK